MLQPLLLVRLPGGNNPDDLGFAIGVNDDQEVPATAKSERHESLFPDRIRVFAGNCQLIFENRGSF